MTPTRAVWKNNGWIIVFASMAALTVGSTSILSYAHNVFLKPMTAEFHWTRAQYFSAFSITGVIGAFLPPFIGRAADRWGVKRVLLPGVIAFGLAVMNLALLNGSTAQFMVFAMLSSATAMFQGPTLYSKAVSGWFDQGRGFALALALTGTALGGVLVPPLASLLIDEFGWRIARVGLGIAVLAIAVPSVWFFIDEPHKQTHAQRSAARALLEGFSAQAAFRSATFWLLLLSFFLSGTAVNAMMTNLGPLITDHGFSQAMATGLVSAVAGGQIAGRFVSGYMLDRFTTPKVGLALLASAAVGTYLLIYSASFAVLAAGAVLLGLGLGAELELAAFYTGRFFGLKNFGQIYGYIFGAYIVGVQAGSFLMGWAFDVSHDYWLGFVGVEAALAIAAVLLVILGPYVFLPRCEADIATPEAAADPTPAH